MKFSLAMEGADNCMHGWVCSNIRALRGSRKRAGKAPLEKSKDRRAVNYTPARSGNDANYGDNCLQRGDEKMTMKRNHFSYYWEEIRGNSSEISWAKLIEEKQVKMVHWKYRKPTIIPIVEWITDQKMRIRNKRMLGIRESTSPHSDR